MVEGPFVSEPSDLDTLYTENIYFKSNLIIITEEEDLSIRRKRELIFPIHWYHISQGPWNSFLKLVLAWHISCMKKTSGSYGLNCFTDQMSASVTLKTVDMPIYADEPIIINYDSFELDNDSEKRIIFSFVGMTTDNVVRPLKDFFLSSLAKYGNDDVDGVEEIIRPFSIEIIREGLTEWIVRHKTFRM